MTTYIITTEMAGGYLPDGDGPTEFEALPTAAVSALLDEAFHALDSDCCDSYDPAECLTCSDRAFIESLRGSEGRADLLDRLERFHTVAVGIESYANGFGGSVRLTEVRDA